MNVSMEETAKWLKEQTDQVWRALGAEGARRDGEMDIRAHGKETIYKFLRNGDVLAEARSYFSCEERQWRFELVYVNQEYYMAVKEYFFKK